MFNIFFIKKKEWADGLDFWAKQETVWDNSLIKNDLKNQLKVRQELTQDLQSQSYIKVPHKNYTTHLLTIQT